MGVWIFSFAMAYIPIHLGWNTDDGQIQNHRITTPPQVHQVPSITLPSTSLPAVNERRCEFENTSVYYVMFVAVGTYFCPLVVLCVVYVRVFGIARRQVAQIRKLAVPVSFQQQQHPVTSSPARMSFSDRRQSSASSSRQLQQQRKVSGGSSDSASRRCLVVHHDHKAAANGLASTPTTTTTAATVPVSAAATAVQASETKATVTLGSVVLAFVVCWVPYFVLFAARPFVVGRGGAFNTTLELFVLWLGYANSMLNPFLYAFYGSEFRHGFQLVLCRRWWRRGDNGLSRFRRADPFNSHDVYYL